MKEQLLQYLEHPNVRQYLSMIAQAEGTANSDNPYAVTFGGGKAESLDTHPNVRVEFTQTDGKKNYSSASGAYQFIKPTWDELSQKLGLEDFSPESQDLAAVALLQRSGSLEDILQGNYEAAVQKDGKTWASLPSSPYPQKTRDAAFIEQALGNGSPQPTASESPSGSLDPNTIPVTNLLDGYKSAKEAGDTEAVNELSALLKYRLEPALKDATAANDMEAVKEIQGLLGYVGGTTSPASSQDAHVAPVEAPKDAPRQDFDWVSNAKTIYQDKHGKPFQGSEAEAKDWLVQEMSDLNNNIVLGGYQASKINDYSPEGKKALLGAMDAYDATDLSDVWKNVGKSVLTDPTTYLGLGIGKVAAKGGQVATKEAVKRGLRESLEKGTTEKLKGKAINSLTGKAAVGAAEGAVYAGGQNLVSQNARVNADGQEEVDLLDTAKSAAIGGTVGGAIGKVVNRLSGHKAIEDLAKKSNGSLEGVKMDAEIVEGLSRAADNPNFRGQDLRTEQLNQLGEAGIKEAQKAIAGSGKQLAAEGLDPKLARSALDRWKSLGADEIDSLRTTPSGNAIADAITKSQLTRSMTAQQFSSGGLQRLARAGADAAPIPQAIRHGVRAVFGGGRARHDVAADLLKKGNVKAANRILADLGNSQASKAGDVLDSLVKTTVAEQAAKATSKIDQKSKAAAAMKKTKIDVLGETGMPMSGAFQTFLDGGASGLNMTSDEAIKGLRLLARNNKNKVIGKAAKDVLKSGNVEQEAAFYGLTNAMRKLREQGVIGGKSQQQQTTPSLNLDAKGNPIKSQAAYNYGKQANQKVYSDVRSDITSLGIPKKDKQIARDAIDALRTGSPSDGQVTIIKVQSMLEKMSPDSKAEVTPLITNLVERFYTQ